MMSRLRETRTLILLIFGAFSLILWLATIWAIASENVLFIVLFGLTALCVSIYEVLYAVLSGGRKRKW